MKHRFAYLFVAGLALVAGPHAGISAAHDPYPAGPVEIMVDGSPRPRYSHDGRWYIEALKGREYAIRLRNPYGVRVAVALSVDGLNTIDARQTTAADARKWVLNTYETVVISGWQTSRTEARRFEFTTEERSYAEALGKTANLGVIAAAFFRERAPDIARDRAITPEASRDDARSRAAAPPAMPAPGSAPAGQEAAAAAGVAGARKADDEYAATGMGRRTGNAVTQVSLELEETPVQMVNIRYEFRPQLVKLGILPSAPNADALRRRERARGFEPGFSPDPRRKP